MPLTWNPRNLTRHYRDRLRKDPGCFEDLLGLSSVMTEPQYETRSHDAVENSWAEYEGQAWEAIKGQYSPERAYFVDDDLVVGITDSFRREFVTCFHEHPGGRHVSRASMPSIDQRRLEYTDRLDAEEQGRMIIHLKRIRGV
jgi:hypothetical protein